MKLRNIVILLAFAAVVFFLFKKNSSMKIVEDPQAEVDPAYSSGVGAVEAKKELGKGGGNSPPSDSQENTSASPLSGNSTTTQELNPVQVEEVQKNFSIQLRQMAQCLAVPIIIDQEKIDPQLNNLTAAVSSGFGNVLVNMDDWNQWDVRNTDGSVKRVRTDVEYLENNVPTKRVQLYKLNDQGMPELQPIDEELALNPTDAYLENLRSGGTVYMTERATRSYFGEGEELTVVERNGKVHSFSMNKGEKTFSCTDTSAPSSTCQCL